MRAGHSGQVYHNFLDVQLVRELKKLLGMLRLPQHLWRDLQRSARAGADGRSRRFSARCPPEEQ